MRSLLSSVSIILFAFINFIPYEFRSSRQLVLSSIYSILTKNWAMYAESLRIVINFVIFMFNNVWWYLLRFLFSIKIIYIYFVYYRVTSRETYFSQQNLIFF